MSKNLTLLHLATAMCGAYEGFFLCVYTVFTEKFLLKPAKIFGEGVAVWHKEYVIAINYREDDILSLTVTP